MRQRSREYLTLSALDPAAHGRREIRRDVVWRYAKRFSSKIVSPLRDESREPTACPSPRNSRKRERNEGTGTRCRVLIRNSILSGQGILQAKKSRTDIYLLYQMCALAGRGDDLPIALPSLLYTCAAAAALSSTLSPFFKNSSLERKIEARDERRGGGDGCRNYTFDDLRAGEITR